MAGRGAISLLPMMGRRSGLLERQRAEVNYRELDSLARCRGESGIDFPVGRKAVVKRSTRK